MGYRLAVTGVTFSHFDEIKIFFVPLQRQIKKRSRRDLIRLARKNENECLIAEQTRKEVMEQIMYNIFNQ